MALGFEGTGATLALFDISGGAPNPLNSAFGSEPSTSIGSTVKTMPTWITSSWKGAAS